MRVPRGTHLHDLEAHAIHVLREAVATSERPVMLDSLGKDSCVLLHLARKAFLPAPPPFPLLHVDTTWKFREMIAFRDRRVRETGMKLLVHVNEEGVRAGVTPFTHDSVTYTGVMKTTALKDALAAHGFDAAIGGARRDEERSRAKERVVSVRDAQGRWDPKRQQPELWNLYTSRTRPGESRRVFPLSDWTELDVWQYVQQEGIPIVPLYLAAPRPVVERDGALIMVDDDRFVLRADEAPRREMVRFRTLGCYPLTGAVRSHATTVEAILEEMAASTTSERQGRLIDHDAAGSMERKKREGYF
jgi:sulfate adenylyltransferase subunit 2